MAIDYETLRQEVQSISSAIPNELEREISKYFDKCGLYYRIFSRCKSAESTVSKISHKKYEETGRKMQDLIGVRIALYFKDDIDICVHILQDNYTVLEVVRDEEKSDTFSPMRLNIVCRIPDGVLALLSTDLWKFPIDTTFEIQVRTVFSEGWHEVEHDLRYKNKSDWDKHIDLSRNLNGIFATLETCDWAILNVFNSLAYEKYKSHEWESMMRHHLRIHMDSNPMSLEIKRLLDNNLSLAKEFFRVDRKLLMLSLSNSNMFSLPKRIDNIVYFLNELIINDPEIRELTPVFLKQRLEPLIPRFTRQAND